MTGEEAIKVLKKTIDNSVEMTIREWEEFDKELAKAIDMAIEALSADAEWIPVSERLPKEDAKYLVQMSYGIMRVLSWANILEKIDDYDFYNEKHGGWYELDSEWGYCEMHGVIAWMPLPEPYKGGDAKMTGTQPYMQPSPDSGADLISRADIQYHTQLEPMGNGQYSDVEVAYKNDIDALPSADAVPVDRTSEWVAVKREEYENYLADRSSGDIRKGEK